MKRILPRAAATLMAVVFAFALSTFGALAASEFEGTWNVKDTKGNAFQIVLAADGKASANREGEGMKGTWKEDNTAAIIEWDTGWTTKISKVGDKYQKAAYEKGKSLEGPPSNTSEAEKAG
jgi:hypothetical protein